MGKHGAGLAKGKETGLWRGGGNVFQAGLLTIVGTASLGCWRGVAGSTLSPCTFSPFQPAQAEVGRRNPRARAAVAPTSHYRQPALSWSLLLGSRGLDLVPDSQ